MGVQVRDKATLIEVGDALAAQIRLHRIQDFRFFQMIEAEGKSAQVLRLLPMKTSISSLLAKWKALEGRNNKRSRLMLKRFFIDPAEKLRLDDMTHANLTYRQALWDYKHYPVWEDKKVVIEAAVAMMFAERDGLCTELKTSDLSAPKILEQAIFEQALRFDNNRKRWSEAILEQYAALETEIDASEARLQRMSRVMVACQKMTLFGTLHWFAKQMPEVDVPGDKLALENLPEQDMTINDKAPEGEYWICVTKKGVFFVPFDAGPGEEFKRSFQFHEEAMDRVVRWGFKQDIVQLVVTGVDKNNAQLGMQEWQVSFQSPSAPDIAFGIQMAKGGFAPK